MSLGGSFSSNGSSSKSWYGPAKPFLNQFLPVGSSALSASSSPDNNPYIQQAQNVLSENVTGQNLNPAANPALAPYVSSLESEANTNLGEQLGNIRSNADVAGVLGSTKAQQNQDQTALQGQQNLTNTIAGLYNSQYGTALNNQQQDIPGLIANADPEYARALQLMQTFGGIGSSTSSGFGVGISGGVGAG